MNQIVEWDLFDKYNYIIHYVRYRKNQIYERITGKNHWAMPKMVAGNILLSAAKTNQIIGDAIQKGEPFWAGRFGGNEMNMVYAVLKYRFHPSKDERMDALKKLCETAGFFPCELEQADRFVDMMLMDCSQIDLEGKWRRYMENYIYCKYQKQTQLTQIFHLEPWNMYHNRNSGVKPWSAYLKGKKVLVIHPFSESIERQYKSNREKIFQRIYKADDILPEFELITLKAVQTMADEEDTRFKTWFEALDWMKMQCKKINFDIAIIGCGAYGYPLAAEIKRMGKIALHLGGATQILFGIIGTRWEIENPQFCKDVVNEYWIRPSDTEKVRGAERIESGCYW